MFRFFFIILSIFLILVIFFRVPQQNLGLSQFSNSFQQRLNIITAIGIFLYFAIAIKLNFSSF